MSSRFRLVWLFARPSVFSANACVVGAGVIMAIGNWAYASRNSLIYDYFFGPYGVWARISHLPSGAMDVIRGIFDRPAAYMVGVAIVAVLAGVAVYVLLGRLGKGAAVIRQTVDEVALADDGSKRLVEREIAARWLLHALFAALWIAWLVLTVRLFGPYSVEAARQGVDDLANPMYWVGAAAGFVAMAACLHVHVVLVRLMLLRPRVFGGDRSIVADLG